MKRLILIAAFILTAGTLAAQNYIIVNSEKVFKSIDAYNTAISDLDKLAKQYQDQVDAKFAEVEALYNNYVSQKTPMRVQQPLLRERRKPWKPSLRKPKIRLPRKFPTP